MITAIIAGITILLGGLLSAIFGGIKYTFYNMLYGISKILLSFVNYFQALVRKLCGLPLNGTDSIDINNSPDLAFSLIRSNVVRNSFFAILAVAMLLIFIFMIVQIIRIEYTTEGDKNTKGNIIKNGLKAFMYFLIVPVTIIFAMVGSSFVLQAIDRATSSSSYKIANQIFMASSYDANYYRNGLVADTVYDGKSFDLSANNTTDKEVKLEKNESIAKQIDDAFMTNTILDNTAFPSLVVFSDYDEGRVASPLNHDMVWSYYKVSKINFVLLIFTAGSILGCLITCSFGLVMRIFNCILLYIISPALIGMFPIDEGKAFKMWTGKFVGNVLAAYGPIIAMNIYFTIMTLVSNLSLFTDADFGPGGYFHDMGMGTANFILNCIFMIVGALMIKDSSKMIASFVGADDAMGTGEAMKKSTIDKAKSVATKAVSGSLMVAGSTVGIASKIGKVSAGSGYRGLTQDEKAKIGDAKESGMKFKNKKEKFDYLGKQEDGLSDKDMRSKRVRFADDFRSNHSTLSKVGDVGKIADSRIAQFGLAGFKATGFAKSMNDVSMGGIKFFGGKGIGQYDSELKGKSDNWESFMMGTLKPKKDRKEDRNDILIAGNVRAKSVSDLGGAAKVAYEELKQQSKNESSEVAGALNRLTDFLSKGTFRNAMSSGSESAKAQVSQQMSSLIDVALSKGSSGTLGLDRRNDLEYLKSIILSGKSIDKNTERSMQKNIEIKGNETITSKLEVDVKNSGNIKEVVTSAIKNNTHGVKVDPDGLKNALKTSGYSASIVNELSKAVSAKYDAIARELADIKAWKRKMK